MIPNVFSSPVPIATQQSQQLQAQAAQQQTHTSQSQSQSQTQTPASTQQSGSSTSTVCQAPFYSSSAETMTPVNAFPWYGSVATSSSHVAASSSPDPTAPPFVPNVQHPGMWHGNREEETTQHYQPSSSAEQTRHPHRERGNRGHGQ